MCLRIIEKKLRMPLLDCEFFFFFLDNLILTIIGVRRNLNLSSLYKREEAMPLRYKALGNRLVNFGDLKIVFNPFFGP